MLLSGSLSGGKVRQGEVALRTWLRNLKIINWLESECRVRSSKQAFRIPDCAPGHHDVEMHTDINSRFEQALSYLLDTV